MIITRECYVWCDGPRCNRRLHHDGQRLELADIADWVLPLGWTVGRDYNEHFCPEHRAEARR